MTETIYWAALGFAGGWLACSAFAVWRTARMDVPGEGSSGMAWKEGRDGARRARR